jgi:DNA-binding XRE family transcriptional regulator
MATTVCQVLFSFEQCGQPSHPRHSREGGNDGGRGGNESPKGHHSRLAIPLEVFYIYVKIGIQKSSSGGALLMSIGTRVMQIRNQKGVSQRELSERSGIAGSYLSRIENRHLEPRPKTLRKIANALEVPLAEFFQEHAENLAGVQCAVTPSGKCVMELIRSGQGKPPQPGIERYTARHLRLIRLAGYLIQSGDRRLLDALEVVLGAMLSNDPSQSNRLGSALVPSNPEPAQRAVTGGE